MVVLGLNGNSKSGKDTVADYLISSYGWNGKIAFAGNLKDIVKHVFKLSSYDVETQEGKSQLFSKPVIFSRDHLSAILIWMSKTHGSLGFPSIEARKEKLKILQSFIGSSLNSPREMLQLVGTEICRTVCENYHTDIIRNRLDIEGCWVITDVRYLNEADLVCNDFSGKVVRIIRPSLDKGSAVYRHSSESSLDDWQGFSSIIINDGDLSSLYKKIDKFIEENNLCQTA